MFRRDQYELLDFGHGRKLERFGPYVLDRESPSVGSAPPSAPALWEQADAQYCRVDGTGHWEVRGELPPRWTVAHDWLRFELKPTDFGHLGLFPEQAANWDWLIERTPRLGPGAMLLNLFAYTGGSTLAAAAAGAQVVHVDAARNVVAWARRNAELSGLADAPIRWIADDARKFVRRELKRGNRYHAVVLDPPSFGHGTRGEVWSLGRDLPGLLRACGKLLDPERGFVLLTCHTTDVDARGLVAMLRRSLGRQHAGTIEHDTMTLVTRGGRRLDGGVVVRWTADK